MVHRADLNSLSASKRSDLVGRMLNYLNDEVVMAHMAIIHSGVELFTGHRAYIAGMESFLSSNGGGEFVPLPMWDPSKAIPTEFNVVKPQDDGTARPALVNLNPNMPLPDQYKYPAVCSFETGADLGNAINGWHGSVHTTINGTMGDIMIASAAPIFWCWHAFLDHVYYDWQLCQVTVPKCTGTRLGLAKFRIKAAGLKVGNVTSFPILLIRPEIISPIHEEPINPALLEQPTMSMPMSMPMSGDTTHGSPAIMARPKFPVFPPIFGGPLVIGQSPAAGTTVSHGSSVDLTVLGD